MGVLRWRDIPGSRISLRNCDTFNASAVVNANHCCNCSNHNNNNNNSNHKGISNYNKSNNYEVRYRQILGRSLLNTIV